jgi:hypothetical protein
LFAEAEWSLDALGLAVSRILEPWLGSGSIFVAVDDTLARKRGKKTFGVGMHHDPLLSSRGKTITNWGHSWVVLGVIVQFPLWPDRAFCLPILFRLYLNKPAADLSQSAGTGRRIAARALPLAQQLRFDQLPGAHRAAVLFAHAASAR